VQQLLIPAILGLGLLAAAAAQGPAAASGDFPVNLRQGIMAGEVGESSVILQSRLTSSNPYQNMAWEGVRGVEGWARFEIAADAGFERAFFTEWLEASPRRDFIVKTRVVQLQPATRYHYRLHYGPTQENQRVSEPATFRTLAGASGAETVFDGDRDGNELLVLPPHRGRRTAALFRAGQGARLPGARRRSAISIPISSSAPATTSTTTTPAIRGRAQTPHEMRKKHHEQYSQPRFIDLFRPDSDVLDEG
jgi:alkaline phosphatase D